MSYEIGTIDKTNIDTVSKLAHKPNQNGGYGKSGLTADALKAQFDSYADAVAQKVNEILRAFASTKTTEKTDNVTKDIAGNGNYISLDLKDYASDNDQVELGESLADLVASFFSGAFAARLMVNLGKDEESDNLHSLLSILNAHEEEKFDKHYNKESETYESQIVTDQITDGAVTLDKLHKNVKELVQKSFSAVKYNSNDGVLSFTDGKGTLLASVELPLKLFVSGGSYAAETKDITLILANGESIIIPLGDIVDTLSGSIADIKNTKFDKFLNPETEEYESQIVTDQIGNKVVKSWHIGDEEIGYHHIRDKSIAYNHLDEDLRNFVESAPVAISENNKRIEQLEGLTLTTITDSTEAYEKTVPADVGKYAVINKVGGMTYKKSKNLLNMDCPESIPSDTATTNTTKRLFEPNTCIVGIARNNYYNPNYVNLVSRTDNSFTLTSISPGYGLELFFPEYGLGFALKLKPNTDYTVSCKNTSARGAIGCGFYDNYGNHLTTQSKEADTFTFSTDNYGNVVLVFSSALKETFTVSNIMLNEGTTALPIESFFEGLQHTKVTSLESRGVNLFDESAITCASKLSGLIDSKLGVVENGYLKAKYGKYANTVLWGPFAMHLTAGTYTISADMYLGSSTTLKDMYLGLRAVSWTSKDYDGATKVVSITKHDVWERGSVTVTLTEDGDYYLEAEARGNAENCTNLDARFKNIQIQRGKTATEFHPFFAEPIATFEISKAIRNREGYGLSGSYIDFDRKVFVNADGEEEDIAAELTSYEDFLFIEVKPGETLKFVNEEGTETPVPSTITYQKKL